MTLKEQEAAAYGGALQAIWCYLRDKGRPADIRDITSARVRLDKRTAEPEPANAATYAALQERFNSLWRTLGPEFRAREKALGRG